MASTVALSLVRWAAAKKITEWHVQLTVEVHRQHSVKYTSIVHVYKFTYTMLREAKSLLGILLMPNCTLVKATVHYC